MPIRELIGHKDGSYSTLSQIGRHAFPASPAIFSNNTIKLNDISTFEMLFDWKDDPGVEVVNITDIASNDNEKEALLKKYGNIEVLKATSSAILIPKYMPYSDTSLLLTMFSPNGASFSTFLYRGTTSTYSPFTYTADPSILLLSPTPSPLFGTQLLPETTLSITEDTTFLFAKYTNSSQPHHTLAALGYSTDETVQFNLSIPEGTFNLNTTLWYNNVATATNLDIKYGTNILSTTTVASAPLAVTSSILKAFDNTSIFFENFSPLTLGFITENAVTYNPINLYIYSTPISSPPYTKAINVNVTEAETSTTAVAHTFWNTPQPALSSGLSIAVTIATNGGSCDVYINNTSQPFASTTTSTTITIPDGVPISNIFAYIAGDGTNATTATLSGHMIQKQAFVHGLHAYQE